MRTFDQSYRKDRISSFQHIFWIAVILLTSILLVKQGKAQSNETEPNNAFSTAQTWELNNVMRLQINPVGDRDIFRLFVPKAGNLTVTVSNAPAGISPEITTFSVADSTMALNNFHNSGNKVELHTVLQAGIYFIRINDWQHNSESNELLDVVFRLDSTDENEYNPSFQKASVITLGADLRANFKARIMGQNTSGARSGNPNGVDMDFYKVFVPRDGNLQVTLNNVPNSAFEPQVRTFHSADTTTVLNAKNQDASTLVTNTILQAGIYYVVVNSFQNTLPNGTLSSDNPPFDVQFYLDTTDRGEFNQYFKVAPVTVPGETHMVKIQGNNFTAGTPSNPSGQDIDLYKLLIPACGEVKISLGTLPAGLNPRIDLFTLADTTSVLESSTTGSLQYMATQVGYYVRIMDPGNNQQSGTPFSLAFTQLSFNIPAPALASFGPFCGNGTIQVAPVTNGVHSWYRDGILLENQTGDAITVTQSGSYTAVVTIEMCSSPQSAPQNIVVNPIPATPVVTGTTVLTSNQANGNQWYRDGVLIPGAVNQSYTPTQGGNYTVVVTLNGCASQPSDPVTVITAVGARESQEFRFYPNPAQSILQLEHPGIISRIEIADLAGRKYLSRDNPGSQLRVEELPAGVYWLTISTVRGQTIHKLIKE